MVCFCFFLFRATLVARGQNGATDASLHHSCTKSQLHLRSTPQPTPTPDSLTHWAKPGIEPTSSWVLLDWFPLSHDGNTTNEWTSEKDPHFLYGSKNEVLLESLIYTRAARLPWVPWYTKKKKKKKKSLLSQVTFLSHSPWWVYYPYSSNSRSGMCISWTSCFTFQLRAGLPSMQELELMQGNYVTRFLDGTTYQEKDFTCSWIMIQVWPKSSDFHSCKDQSEKWSRCQRYDVRCPNGIASQHPQKPHPDDMPPIKTGIQIM